MSEHYNIMYIDNTIKALKIQFRKCILILFYIIHKLWMIAIFGFLDISIMYRYTYMYYVYISAVSVYIYLIFIFIQRFTLHYKCHSDWRLASVYNSPWKLVIYFDIQIQITNKTNVNFINDCSSVNTFI